MAECTICRLGVLRISCRLGRSPLAYCALAMRYYGAVTERISAVLMAAGRSPRLRHNSMPQHYGERLVLKRGVRIWVASDEEEPRLRKHAYLEARDVADHRQEVVAPPGGLPSRSLRCIWRQAIALTGRRDFTSPAADDARGQQRRGLYLQRMRIFGMIVDHRYWRSQISYPGVFTATSFIEPGYRKSAHQP